jgi:acyl-CoA synthetase (AMP-forming)/AMP-acid ligase II/CBS domain-containing protein
MLTETARALTAADLMTTDVLTVPPTMPLTAAARLLTERGVGSAVVVDAGGGLPIGMLTERDLVRFVSGGPAATEPTVADYMSADPTWCGPTDEAIAVHHQLAAGGYRHLPVVEGGQLVGLVSMRDLLLKLPAPTTVTGGAALPPRPTRPTTELVVSTLLQAAPAADAAIVVPDGPRLTYGALREGIDQVATALAQYGVVRGDRVAIVLGQSPSMIVGILGAATVATAAPLNPNFTADEFTFFYDDVSARALLVPAGGAEVARAAWAGDGPIIEVTLADDGQLTLASDAPRDSRKTATAPTPDDVALILHSSGTTGRPKRAALRHRNLVASADNIVSTYQLTSADVTLCVMPLFHVHGLVASVLASFTSGGTVVLPNRFNPLGFWRLVSGYRTTWYTAVPSIHQLVMARAQASSPDDGTSLLRFVRSASAPMPQATLAQIEQTLNVPMLEAFGMTEASHQVSSNPLPPAPRLAGSVGRGFGVRVGVMDDAGRMLTVGATGEVVIQGPNVIDGYDNNPDANASSFATGWFRTGDLGVIDATGYLSLVGRLKEMINRGGEKIAPVEVDDVLTSHPLVAEAVVFGAPHPTWGEEVEAVVVLKGDVSERDLQRYCAEHLSDFKVPKKFYIREAIPRSATGKVQRNRIRGQLGLE